MKRFALASLFVVLGLGCAMSAEPVGQEDTSVSQESLEGCRTVCPPCPDGQICPMLCYVVCKDKSQKCGHKTCADTEFCCNESCGICAPLGGTCTQQLCTKMNLK